MGRAFEYRKAAKLKRWGNMARTFTRVGKQIAIAVKAGGIAQIEDMNFFHGMFRLFSAGNHKA